MYIYICTLLYMIIINHRLSPIRSKGVTLLNQIRSSHSESDYRNSIRKTEALDMTQGC